MREGRRQGLHDVSTKTSATDMVTEYDRQSEALIVSGLLAARPDDGIVGEEGTDRPGTSGVQWLIDPIDGTTNFLYGLPGYAISIAAADPRRACWPAWSTCRRSGETFHAGRGRRRLPRRPAHPVLGRRRAGHGTGGDGVQLRPRRCGCARPRRWPR